MSLLVDVIYILILPIVVLYAAWSRVRGHPRRKDLAGRLGFGVAIPPHAKRILLHAVSVGEVNAIRVLVPKLVEEGYDVVICVTTDTGLTRAIDLFGHAHTVTRFPFDLSFSMRRFIQRIQPTIVALVELEVWPNMIRVCSRREIPIVVINGRLSERSYRRYKLVKPLLQRTFARLTAIGMQNDIYAQRVRELNGNNVSVLGTMKWDNAILHDTIAGASELAADLGIDPSKPLIVVGSSTPAEHTLLKEILPKDVQLLCAPRRPEWFDEAADTFPSCNRRTNSIRHRTNYFLLDTIGELDKAYSIADLVVIGRSFTPMHGSDPTQPIALGKPTIIGPYVSDFVEMVDFLVQGKGLIQCSSVELEEMIKQLLTDSVQCKSLADAGRRLITSQQGATDRYLELILESTPS